MRAIEQPVTTRVDSPTHESVTTHPAFVQISASRVSGQIALYGSDFVHQQFITITISRSELNRGLSNDWPFSREELIEVCLSGAQWAAFVSTMNGGRETQCTLNRINREPVPALPNPEPRSKQFSAELRETMAEARSLADELRGLVGSTPALSAKRKQEINRMIERIERACASSAEFVADQFDEHIERTVEHAKIEIHAYMQHAAARAAAIGVSKEPERLTLTNLGEVIK